MCSNCNFFFPFLQNCVIFQLIFYKENSPHYDAGIAVDDVRFYDCPLPRPTIDNECPTEEWRCSNKVINYVQLPHRSGSNFSLFRSVFLKIDSVIYLMTVAIAPTNL